MDRNIYRLSNEVEMDLDQYKAENISEAEVNNIRQYVKSQGRDNGNKPVKKPSKRNNIYRKAAAAILLCLGTGAIFNNEVYAFVERVSYKLTSIWELDNVDKYVNVINTSQQAHGYTITLNEVILDHDELIVCQTIKGDEKLGDYLLGTGRLKIDGAYIDTGGSGGGDLVDEYTQEEIFYYSISEGQLSMDGSHEIEYSITGLRPLADAEEIKGDWTFRFTVTGDELSKDTVRVAMNDEINLPEGLALKFTRYSANKVNQKIYFRIIGDYLDFNCDMELRGMDDLGNLVVFYMSSISEGEGVFKVDTSENGYISEDAKQLVLSLYTAEMPLASGQMNSVYELYEGNGLDRKEGQEIIVNIVGLK